MKKCDHTHLETQLHSTGEFSRGGKYNEFKENAHKEILSRVWLG